MAISIALSQKELERIAALAYETKTLKVMLCAAGLTGYTAQTTVANWQTVEVSGSGYSRYSVVIGAGAYNNTTNRYELPTIDAVFTVTAPLEYDRVVLYIDGATYPHSVLTESPGIALSAGQTQTYRLNLNTDD